MCYFLWRFRLVKYCLWTHNFRGWLWNIIIFHVPDDLAWRGVNGSVSVSLGNHVTIVSLSGKLLLTSYRHFMDDEPPDRSQIPCYHRRCFCSIVIPTKRRMPFHWFTNVLPPKWNGVSAPKWKRSKRNFHPKQKRCLWYVGWINIFLSQY